MGDPRHMDGGGDVSSDAAFDGVVVSAAELTSECNESRLSGGEVLEHLSLDFDALAFVDERDTRMAALEEQVRALQVAVRSLQLAREAAGSLPHLAPACLDGTLCHPPPTRIPDAFPNWRRCLRLTAAEQLVEWFERRVTIGENTYPPVRLWTPEARDAAGWRGGEGAKLGHFCKAYYRVRAVMRLSPACIDLPLTVLRNDPALNIPRGSDWWSECVAWYDDNM